MTLCTGEKDKSGVVGGVESVAVGVVLNVFTVVVDKRGVDVEYVEVDDVVTQTNVDLLLSNFEYFALESLSVKG